MSDNYLHLLDKKTDTPLDPASAALDFVLKNNEGRDDAKVKSYIDAVPKDAPLAETLASLLNRQHTQGRDATRNPEVMAIKDAMAYFQLESDIRAAQAAGQTGLEDVNLKSLQYTAVGGATRYNMDKAAEKRAEDKAAAVAKEDARVAARSPLEQALEEQVHGKEDRKDVKAILDGYTKQGVTSLSAAADLKIRQDGMGLIGESWDIKTAGEVLERARAIAQDRGREADTKGGGFSMAILATPEKTAVATPAPEVAPVKAAEKKTEISQLDIALGKIDSTQRDAVGTLLKAEVFDKKMSLGDGLAYLKDKQAEMEKNWHAPLPTAKTYETATQVLGNILEQTKTAIVAKGASEASATPATVAAQPEASTPAAAATPAAATTTAAATAPAQGDEPMVESYKGKTYAASTTPRTLLREGQAYLQLIDAEKYNTGGKNSQCPKDANYTSGAMDGICGQYTDAAVRLFQKDNKLEETGKFDDVTMAKLKELAEPKLAVLKGQTQPAPEVATTTTVTQQPATTEPAAPTLTQQVQGARELLAALSADAVFDNSDKGKLVVELANINDQLAKPGMLTEDIKTQIGGVLTALKDTGSVQDTDQILGATMGKLRETSQRQV